VAYQLEEVRAGIRRYGLQNYRPYQGESSNWGIVNGAVELYVFILDNRLGASEAVKPRLIKALVDLLALTPPKYRAAKAREVFDALGEDLSQDPAYEQALATAHVTY
jgi:hypothetical protein